MPDRWRSFGIHLLRKLLKKVDGSEWTPEIWEVEQFMYRYLMCEECMKKGTCANSDCGCKMPERAHVRTDFCPTQRWGPFLNERGWERFKKKEKFNFLINKTNTDVKK